VKELDVCVSSSVCGFCEYFIGGSCDSFPSEFQLLALAVNTLIISSAECEQLFHAMNTTIFCVQSSALLRTAAVLMFMSLVGPPLREFNKKNCVKEWLKSHHHADSAYPAPAGRSHKICNSENTWKIF
jgi:hypothetical protein